MTVIKVLIDGGAGLNIIFVNTLRKIGLDFEGLLTPTDVPFYKIAPSKAAMPLGQITLLVTFGALDNYRTEFIKFEVADFESSYHAIFGRPVLAKFMAVLHYPCLLLKMLGPNSILSLRGDLKRSYDCDAQAIRIAAKVQPDLEGEEIATLANQLNTEESKLPTKRPAILVPPKEANVIKIDLSTGDPAKMATISAYLPKEQELMLTNFFRDNNDIFAWKPADMLGVLRKLAEH
jgi:hypothetical protein